MRPSRTAILEVALVVLSACIPAELVVAGDGGATDAPADGTVDHRVLVDGCTPSGPEICTDGIDNDCDGLTDCADMACMGAGYTCVPAPPASSPVSAADLAGRPPCPSGSGAPTDFIADPNLGPAPCTCSCAVGQSPSCTTGALSSSRYGTGPNPTCPMAGGTFSAGGGVCTPGMIKLEPYILVPPLGPTGGTCASTIDTVAPDAGTAGRACPLTGPFGGGCDAGHVCASTAGPTFAACVTDGDGGACPTAFPKRHAIGTTVDDTRGCTSCSCGSPTGTCTNAKWSFYQDPSCATTPTTITVDGNCDPSNNPDAATEFLSYIYAATVNAQCAPPSAQPMPTGSASLVNPSTLCCTR